MKETLTVNLVLCGLLLLLLLTCGIWLLRLAILDLGLSRLPLLLDVDVDDDIDDVGEMDLLVSLLLLCSRSKRSAMDLGTMPSSTESMPLPLAAVPMVYVFPEDV